MSFIDIIKNSPIFSNCGVAGCGKVQTPPITENEIYKRCLKPHIQGMNDEDIPAFCLKYTTDKIKADAEYAAAMEEIRKHGYSSNANLPPHEGGGKQGGKLPDAVPPKYDINYTNTAIFGAIGGGIGYLVAKKLIKTDKVLFPILIGAAAFAYYHIDMSKKNR